MCKKMTISADNISAADISCITNLHHCTIVICLRMRTREELSLTDSVTENHDSPLQETRTNERMKEQTNDSTWRTDRRELIHSNKSWNPPLVSLCVLIQHRWFSTHCNVIPPRPYLTPRESAVLTRWLHIETFWAFIPLANGGRETRKYSPQCPFYDFTVKSEDLSQHNYTVFLLITQHVWVGFS